MAKQTVPLYTVSSGDRVDRARASLAGALGDAQLGDADDGGGFDVTLDADSSSDAEELVREALASSGTGDDFVLRGSITGREMPADDPRQPEDAADDEPPAPSPDERAGHVADAASRVADAARAAAADPESTVADASSKLADEAPNRVAEVTRRLAANAPGPVEEAAAKLAEEAPKRVQDATRRLADSAPGAAGAAAERVRGTDWKRLSAPLGAGFVALLVIARLRRR